MTQTTTRIHVGDCLPWLGDKETNSVDLVWSDPPYNAKKDYGPGAKDSLPWPEYWAWVDQWLPECERIARRGVALLLPHRLLREYWIRLPKASQIIVPKHTQGCIQDGWQRQYLAVLSTAACPEPRMAGARCVDLLPNISLPGDGYFFKEDRPAHPAFTCEALASWGVNLLTEPGEVIADPFFGSGTMGVAALRYGRGFIGCEQNFEFAALAEKRIEQERDKLQLPFEEAHDAPV